MKLQLVEEVSGLFFDMNRPVRRHELIRRHAGVADNHKGLGVEPENSSTFWGFRLGRIGPEDRIVL
jgi:hypothetical protein